MVSPTTTPTPSRRRKLTKVDRAVTAQSHREDGSIRHKLKVIHAAVDSLKPYEKNPRKGNIPAIMLSLRTNGQYRPIVVQRRGRRIIAGNHTWVAAKRLGWKTLDIVYVDVSDEEAARIVLADNRTNDLATYDLDILAEVIASLPDVSGTGYTEADAQALVKAVSIDTEIARETVESIINPEYKDEEIPTLDESAPTAGNFDEGYEDKPPDEDIIESQPKTLPGIAALNPILDWHGKTYSQWDIPVLRSDALMQPNQVIGEPMMYIPTHCQDWPDDQQMWWVRYKSGVDAKGLQHPENAILSFHSHDYHFNVWWDDMAAKVTQFLNSEIAYTTLPDFSQYIDAPRMESLWAMFRQRYIGRYMQEAGIIVMPPINPRIHDSQFTDDYLLPTLPKGKVPVAECEMQNAFDQFKADKQFRDWLTNEYKKMVDYCGVEVLFVYGRDEPVEAVHRMGLGVKRIIQIQSFIQGLTDHEGIALRRSIAENGSRPAVSQGALHQHGTNVGRRKKLSTV